MFHKQKMFLLFLHNSKELFISPACNQYDDDNDNIKCMWTLIVHRIYCRDSIQQSIWRLVNTLRLIPALAPGVITNLASNDGTGVPLLGPSAPFSRAVCGLQSIENVVKQRELVPANEDIVADNWCVVWIDLPTYSPHVRNWSCQTGQGRDHDIPSCVQTWGGSSQTNYCMKSLAASQHSSLILLRHKLLDWAVFYPGSYQSCINPWPYSSPAPARLHH